MARLKPSEEKKLRQLASLDPKVASELEKHDQLTARLSDFLAQQSAQNRKSRNREMMIIGSCVSLEMETNLKFRAGLTELLNRHSTRVADRKFLISRGWEITENDEDKTANSGSISAQ